ncbi:MAG: hypothetical protein KAT68_17360 [Bacteroidales bacterium]|nr:hypothetical protein [Bacteroidales bacterium]
MTQLEIALKCKHNGGNEDFLNQFFAEHEDEILAYKDKYKIDSPIVEVKFIWYWAWLVLKKINGEEVI